MKSLKESINEAFSNINEAKYFREISDLESRVASLVSDVYISTTNNVLTVNYTNDFDKTTVLKELAAVKKEFPKAKLKGRKFLKIELPYKLLTKDEILAGDLHGFSWVA